MARGFSISTRVSGAEAVQARLEAGISRAQNLQRPLTRLGEYHQRKAMRVLRGGERGIRSRTGGLGGSITYALAGENQLTVGSNKVYAGSQQFGPRLGHYESTRSGGSLAVPIADNIGAKQQPTYTSPRQVSDGFFLETNAGKVLFVRRRDKEWRKGRRGRSKFHQAMNAASAGLKKFFDVLFVIVKRTRDRERPPPHEGRYVTHDPDDQTVWDRYVGDWIVRGR